MKILYIDMDGVIVDFESVNVAEEDIRTYGSKDNIPGLYAKMKPMPGAIEAVKKLAEVYDVYILSTAPWGNPSAWKDKLEWIKNYLPNVVRKKLILSHNKHLNWGDYLIDDNPNINGADEFGGDLLHFGKNGKYKTWNDILNYLLQEDKFVEKPYERDYDEKVLKTWELLSENTKTEESISRVDSIIYFIMGIINIYYGRHPNEELTFDKVLDYVEDELYDDIEDYETEFVEEVIKTYNKLYNVYEETDV